MSRFHSYVLSAQHILKEYKGEQPFPFHLKQFFSAHKKYGSKDRKLVSECCYAWLRCAHLFKKICTEKEIMHSVFLCSDKPNLILENIDPDLNTKTDQPVLEKLQLLHADAAGIFPFSAYTGFTDKENFFLSFLKQPSLFLRIRPGKEKIVLTKLDENSVPYTVMNDCIELPNATRLDEIIQINKDAVVQDKNSQRVFDFLQNIESVNNYPDVWDCCTASGGKSILLYDRLQKKIKLTVSDIRSSILHNCKLRLQQAAVNIHHAFVADISKPVAGEMLEGFDIIICDVPCTGSGTWSRTPEQLAFFEENKIGEFSLLQKSIAANAVSHLKKNSIFIYITCSVFSPENEEVVAYLQEKFRLKLLHSTYLKGYETKADTMFVAYFRN